MRDVAAHQPYTRKAGARNASRGLCSGSRSACVEARCACAGGQHAAAQRARAGHERPVQVRCLHRMSSAARACLKSAVVVPAQAFAARLTFQ